MVSFPYLFSKKYDGGKKNQHFFQSLPVRYFFKVTNTICRLFLQPTNIHSSHPKAEENSKLVNLPLALFWGDLSQTPALQADACLGASATLSFLGSSLGTAPPLKGSRQNGLSQKTVAHNSYVNLKSVSCISKLFLKELFTQALQVLWSLLQLCLCNAKILQSWRRHK